MNRRSFLSLSNSLFWVLVFGLGVFVFLRNQPKSTVDLRTSSTRNYELAVFTSPGKRGGTRWSVYRRPANSQNTSDWKYVMAMASGKAIDSVKAWESKSGDRVMVTFPDSYIVANLKSGVLERVALVIGDENDLDKIKSESGVYDALTFSKPYKVGPWLWQDRQWKGMLHNDPQIQL